GLLGMQMYMHGKEFYRGDGIVAGSVEDTIRNVGSLAQNGMAQTDRLSSSRGESAKRCFASLEHDVCGLAAKDLAARFSSFSIISYLFSIIFYLRADMESAPTTGILRHILSLYAIKCNIYLQILLFYKVIRQNTDYAKIFGDYFR
ncbi:MAG: hypothetical protein IIX69_02765, partial [Clostridia bacterium]|nr:hypothetical protein [Clostridia bacterium]